MTQFSSHQIRALALLVRERDAHQGDVLPGPNHLLNVTLYDDTGDLVFDGSISAGGTVRENATVTA